MSSRSGPLARASRLPMAGFREAARKAIGPAVALALAAAVGAASAAWPPAALALAAAAAALLLLLRRMAVPAFFAALSVLLVGYAFLSRSFAYLGAPPVYVGEVGLGLAIVALISGLPRISPRGVEWLLLAFMALGAVDTLAYLPRDGPDALRDGTLWGYAFFALAIGLLGRVRHLERAVSIYGRVVPIFIVSVIPLAILATQLEGVTIPGTNVAIVTFKGGDAGVHLAGAIAFLIVGLAIAAPGFGRFPAIPLIALWLPAFAVVALGNRGGLLAASAGWLLATLLAPTKRWLMISILAALGVVFAAVFWPGGELPFNTHNASPAEIVTSLAVESDDGRLEGTKEYRLRWWGTIVDYTVNGPYFWTGKGFGVNLAVDDGFLASAGSALRAPHNSHVTVLARMGVPGLALWIALQTAFAVSLFRAFLRSRRNGMVFWSRVDVWLLAYWLAIMVNTSFDPYLEGPQGGIWFWSVMGFGLAALRAQHDAMNPESASIRAHAAN